MDSRSLIRFWSRAVADGDRAMDRHAPSSRTREGIQWMAPRGLAQRAKRGTGTAGERDARARWTSGTDDGKCWYLRKRRRTDGQTDAQLDVANLRRNHGTGWAATLAPGYISLIPPRPGSSSTTAGWVGGVAWHRHGARRPAAGTYTTSLALVGPLCSGVEPGLATGVRRLHVRSTRGACTGMAHRRCPGKGKKYLCGGSGVRGVPLQRIRLFVA